MAKRYSVSALRANLYRLLDQVLETGIPLEIERNGMGLRIAPLEGTGRLERLQPHSGFLVGDPAAIVHVDWSGDRRT
ncbi:MAG: type II toxin-antitoxin system Phd/YefM family antitoxin [Longimicrobiales bacterium]